MDDFREQCLRKRARDRDERLAAVEAATRLHAETVAASLATLQKALDGGVDDALSDAELQFLADGGALICPGPLDLPNEFEACEAVRLTYRFAMGGYKFREVEGCSVPQEDIRALERGGDVPSCLEKDELSYAWKTLGPDVPLRVHGTQRWRAHVEDALGRAQPDASKANYDDITDGGGCYGYDNVEVDVWVVSVSHADALRAAFE